MRLYKRGRDSDGARSDELTDITMMAGLITLEGEVGQASRKLMFDFLRDDQDYYLSQRATIQRGDAVVLLDDGDSTLEDSIFYGIVWEIDEDDSTMQKSVTCYDNMKYLMTSDVITNVWTDVTAVEVTQTVCEELGITCGDLPETDVKINVNARDKKGYQAIMIAWTETRKETEKYYYPRMVGHKFTVIEKGEKLEGKELKYQSQDLPCSLTNVVKKEDSSEAVTSLWERSEDGTATEIETDDELYHLLGYIVGMNEAGQSTDQDDVKEINDGKITVTASAIGDWKVQTGWMIPITSKTITADLYIEKDTHVLENGIHTMELELSFENSMDEMESAPEQTVDEEGNIVDTDGNIIGTEGDGVYTGSVGWPFAGGAGTVTQGFMVGGHRGWDISTTGGGGAGSPVLAVDGGVVIGAGWQLDDWSYGNAVTIQHTSGLCTRYAHLYAISVSAGMKVSKGQQIGIEGNTGNSFGTHLHIEFLSSLPWGSLYNPGNYLNRYG